MNAARQPIQPAPRRNVLFITSDQQHWLAMGYLNPEVKTPNLDRLVRSGMTFHRAYTVNPTCTPTRASWITGLYPSQHGAYSLGTKLMESLPTIGDYFQQVGYHTGLVGKAHFQPLLSTPEYPSLEAYPLLHDLEFWRSFTGPFYGFKQAELARNHTDESHVGQHYALWLTEKTGGTAWRKHFLPNPRQYPDFTGYPESDRTRLANGDGVWDIPAELHYNTWIAERTNAQLSDCKARGENFFLWASFFDPHPQYMVPEPYASMYDSDNVTVPEHTPGEFDDKPPYFKHSQDPHADSGAFAEPGGNAVHGSGCHLVPRELRAKRIATMYGMMTMLDAAIGTILDKLDELGLTENTLVCFTTDHGDFMGQHGLTMKAIHHYEDLLRVPLVASLPGVIPAGVVSDALQSTVDLPQTFLDIAGVPVPRTMAGVVETPVWTGDAPAVRDHVVIENQHQPTTLNLRTLVTARHKLTVHFNKPYGELYDLEQDPCEIVNLWDHPECAALKRDLLLKFVFAEMAKAPLPMPRIAPA